VKEEVEVENGESGQDPAIENEADQEAVVMKITDAADQVEKIAGIADQAAAEAIVVAQVTMKAGEAKKIKRVQVLRAQRKKQNKR